MCPVEMFTLLDDEAEDEVAEESDDDDEEIKYDVSPAVIEENNHLLSDLIVTLGY